MAQDLAASVRARLLTIAKAERTDFNAVLVRYALERFLYRLSQSAHANLLVLKGAMLFNLWYAMPHRSTRDVDLLGFGASDLGSIAQAFREIVSVAANDGLLFDAASVNVQEIRKSAGYAGARVLVSAELARASCKTQIDIGFGDAITPGPVDANYPVLIADFPPPQLRTYPGLYGRGRKVARDRAAGHGKPQAEGLPGFVDFVGSRDIGLWRFGQRHCCHIQPSRNPAADRPAHRFERRVCWRWFAPGAVGYVLEKKCADSYAVRRSRVCVADKTTGSACGTRRIRYCRLEPRVCTSVTSWA